MKTIDDVIALITLVQIKTCAYFGRQLVQTEDGVSSASLVAQQEFFPLLCPIFESLAIREKCDLIEALDLPSETELTPDGEEILTNARQYVERQEWWSAI